MTLTYMYVKLKHAQSKPHMAVVNSGVADKKAQFVALLVSSV